jgi:hypothetical protein
MRPLLCFLTLFVTVSVQSQRYLGMRPTPTGGPLSAEQASYDVTMYDIVLSVNPDRKWIEATVSVSFRVVQPMEWLVLDLDTTFDVLAVKAGVEPLAFERRETQLWIRSGRTWRPGELSTITIEYNGRPREALRPPWIGGFTWTQSADGKPWVGLSCQNDGADVWIPCKDHQSDEPDSVKISIEVPDPLIAVSAGKFMGRETKTAGRTVYRWKINSPINNYNISVNIGPYETVSANYKNIFGEAMPVTWWVLPEDKSKAEKLMPEILDHIRFYEELLGPYPYRSEKFGIVETPFLGMEHSTAIAFGNAAFTPNEYGWNTLHHHELGHEWWGNLVTAADWKDFWIHEAFCLYMQALYNEQRHGEEKYHEYIQARRPRIRNRQPAAPRHASTALEVYFAAPDYVQSDGDVYNKGSQVLHALRYLVGKDKLIEAFRQFCYPTEKDRRATDGRQFHFASTQDFLTIVENVSGMKLGWLFDMYLHQPELPNLIVNPSGDSLLLEWSTPDDLPFPMPVEVLMDGRRQRIDMARGRASVKVSSLDRIHIDPDGWILKRSEWKDKRELRRRIQLLPHVLSFQEIPTGAHFKQAYAIRFKQPLDHGRPNAGSFTQVVELYHADTSAPMLIETCGYALEKGVKEIAEMTGGNQLTVEYRFFGESRPDTIPWKYLTIQNAAADYHRLAASFKNVYKGKWIASGISKGGQASVIYRYAYPADVEVTVPYVTPFPTALEDRRTDLHVRSIGDASARDAVFAFQRLALSKHDSLKIWLAEYTRRTGQTFSIGDDVAIEYAILEYPFSFWQWDSDDGNIPGPQATAWDVFQHLDNTAGFYLYSDEGMNYYRPHYYQSMSQLGYYGFMTDHLEGKLKFVKNPSNRFFAPAFDIRYDGSYSKNVIDWAETKAERMMFIYGEYDTWTACGITPQRSVSKKFVKRRGTHTTRIRDLSDDQRKEIYRTLKEWLGVEIQPLY